ncbi:unnamed protein product [Rotaria sp. Silwood2]|nr:unnamed protein product [Rotaria sp. Silwood2]
MFTFLSFSYVIVISLNVCDFFLWLYAITPPYRLNFVCKRLHSKKYPLTNEINDQPKIIEFTNDYLETDGFFILSLIKENTSDYVAAEIVHRLYTEKFLKRSLDNTTIEAIYDDKHTKKDNDSKRSHLCSLIC